MDFRKLVEKIVNTQEFRTNQNNAILGIDATDKRIYGPISIKSGGFKS